MSVKFCLTALLCSIPEWLLQRPTQPAVKPVLNRSCLKITGSERHCSIIWQSRIRHVRIRDITIRTRGEHEVSTGAIMAYCNDVHLSARYAEMGVTES